MRSPRSIAVVLAASAALISPGSAAASGPDPSQIGQWSPPIQVGTVGIHAALLHTGKVLLYQYLDTGVGSEAKLFDPVAGDVTDVSLPIRRDIFCSGLSVMPDGRVLVTGGMRYGATGNDGINNVTIFDPVSQAWSNAKSLAYARWYPTNVQMPDGTTLVLSGQLMDGHVQRKLESYDPSSGQWTTLPPSADQVNDLYPRMAVLPDGRVFRAGPEQESRMFDPVTNSWSTVAPMNYGWRSEGGVVLLPGLHAVLTAGGFASTDATRTAEVIDLSKPAPRWEYTGSMNRPREELNLVLLADGTVLAVGGGFHFSYVRPMKQAEIYDPATGAWTLMAAQRAQRMYHSTAVLLPDGRVLSAGSDHGPLQTSVEIFSPPYLFRGPRPTISSAPGSLTYGQQFTISTPDAADISRVALVRPGATTHANDFDQRYVDLNFTASHGSISATAPTTAAMAPPGYYMLFIVNSAGVPSVAPFVLVH